MKNKYLISLSKTSRKLFYIFLCISILLSGCGIQKSSEPKKETAESEPGEKIESKARPAESPPLEEIEFSSAEIKEINDNIAEFIDSRTHSNGLIRSFYNTSPYFFGLDTGTFHACYYGKMGYLDDQAFTYDLALAVIGQLLIGNVDEAEKILNLFEKDFYLKKNGKIGLFNSYLVTSKVPEDELQMGVDGDRMHAGPTLWVAIAAINHINIQDDPRYLRFVLDIVNWCREDLTYYRFDDGQRGGISMGFGWGPDWSQIFSTEHNIDYFAVLRMLHEIYSQSPYETRKIFKEKNIDDAWLEDEMEHVGRWLSEVVFDKEDYCFVAGVNQAGVDRMKILDGTSWGIGGIGPENLEKWGIDLDKLIKSTEKHFKATYPLPNGRVVEGYDFTDREGTGFSREPLVWFEGSGQLVIAYGELANYYFKKGQINKAVKYKVKALLLMNEMHQFSNYYKLKDTFPYMAIRPGEKDIIMTLKYEWEIPRGGEQAWVKCISSTMWFLYSVNNLYNPMKWKRF